MTKKQKKSPSSTSKRSTRTTLSPKITSGNLTPGQAVELVAEHGGIRAAVRATGLTFHAVRARYADAVKAGKADAFMHPTKTRDEIKEEMQEPEVRGRNRALETRPAKLPKRGVRRYILTCAQNNTHLHQSTWESLLALAAHYEAEIKVARFTYDKSSNSDRKIKPGTRRRSDYEGLHYDDRILPFVDDGRVELAPGLVWCGEMNILPTAVRPLSGLETYTGRKSGIVPHVKIALESIASGKHEATKFMYTTGTITQRNYIQRKAGLKAEFHHCYGGLLVEVDTEGNWFARQLNADSEGVIYDLDLKVEGGVVTSGHRPEAITWGDVHVAEIDPVVKELAWGKGGMLDTLKPRYQFLHDVLDFTARSHHDRMDFHRQFQLHVQRKEDVRKEVDDCGLFIGWAARRSHVRTVVVDSNHHNHLGRWLNEQDARKDPVNAEFWFRVQAEIYKHIRRSLQMPGYLWAGLWATDVMQRLLHVKFLGEDESFVICPDANGGIECGMHGDLGPGGARGTPQNLAKMGRKANTGHTHKAAIVDGMYVAGCSCVLDPDWVRGPSAWSHSHVITYPNGKRAIITMWAGKWRA